MYPCVGMHAGLFRVAVSFLVASLSAKLWRIYVHDFCGVLKQTYLWFVGEGPS
jgi:hypothetical protein